VAYPSRNLTSTVRSKRTVNCDQRRNINCVYRLRTVRLSERCVWYKSRRCRVRCHSTHGPYLIGCYVGRHGAHSCFRWRQTQHLLTLSWCRPCHGWRVKYNPSGPRRRPIHFTRRSREEQQQNPSSYQLSNSRLIFRISKTDKIYKILRHF
jgi:hypothetical protein